MKKKVIQRILIICFIIIVILFCVIQILIKNQNKEVDYFEELATEEYKNGQVVPQGVITLIREYEGEVEIEEWYVHLYSFVNDYIPEIRSSNISKYYEDNYLDIKQDLGIDSYEQFEVLAKEIKKISKGAKFKNSEFDVSAMDVQNDFICAKLTIFFKNGESLNVKFTIYNKVIDGISISILPET